MKSLVFSAMPMEFEKMPSDKTIVEKNLFVNNVGNEYFFNAVVKSLHSPRHEIIRYNHNVNLNEINQGLLIDANLIRKGFKGFDPIIKRVHDIDLPFVCICVGSDSDSRFQFNADEEVLEKAYDLYSEVLKRSNTMGVRGDFTKKVLVKHVGIPSKKINVIGCPSVRYFGKQFIETQREYPEFNKNLKIAVNYTAYAYNYYEALYLALILKQYEKSFMIFTDKVEAELLWYKIDVPVERRHELLPSTANHPFLSKSRFAATQKGMMRMISTFDFSIGSRIHQAIIAILSGCPAIVIAYSSRILELAEHHHIPYILRSELIENFPPLEELYARACEGMKYFYANYNKLLKEYTDFLEKNGLDVNEDYLIN